MFALTSLLVTYIISSRLQPIYESTVGINIDRQAPSGVVGEDAQKMSYAPQDADEYIATQIKIIQSDPVLRPVARKYNLLEREKRFEGLTPERTAAIMDAPTSSEADESCSSDEHLPCHDLVPLNGPTAISGCRQRHRQVLP